MIKFHLSFVAVLLSLGALLVGYGDSPERRYEGDACQYRMIYDYNPDPEMAFVTLGGSRVRVSTSADDFNAVLKRMRPNAAPMHNLSHSVYSLEKEYVILRDLLERHNPKAVLIMIEPRRNDFGSAHPSFTEIARLRDIPLAMYALWPESPVNAVRAARDIIFQQLDVFDRVGKQHREMTDRNCDRADYRIDVDGLNNAAEKFESVQNDVLDWDVSAASESGFRRWIKAYHDLSRESGTEVIFILITGTSEPLPSPSLEADFEEATGLPLITLSPDLHKRLSSSGKRDSVHLNHIGRAEFLPWLIEAVERKCKNPTGCF